MTDRSWLWKHGKKQTTKRERENRPKDGRLIYDKNLTVNLELLGDEKIPTIDVITNVKMLCGGLMACRSVGPRKLEVTMSIEKGKERLS